jgi:hypothetical protein
VFLYLVYSFLPNPFSRLQKAQLHQTLCCSTWLNTDWLLFENVDPNCLVWHLVTIRNSLLCNLRQVFFWFKWTQANLFNYYLYSINTYLFINYWVGVFVVIAGVEGRHQ